MLKNVFFLYCRILSERAFAGGAPVPVRKRHTGAYPEIFMF